NITDNLKIKIDNCPDKEYYKDLKVGFDKLCFECYMKIVDSHRLQISTINRNNELDNSNLMEINDLNESNRFNTSANLMNINNLIEINDSTTSDLMEISNLIETNESEIKNSVNLIELIEAQKEYLNENNLNEINQQFVDIKVDITNNMVSIDLENFDQLIKLIVQKDLKIESLIDQNNNLMATTLNNSESLINQNNNLIATTLNNSALNYSFSQQMELLTTVLLKYQKENNEYLLDPGQFAIIGITLF
ncbi:865_t:CDS:2, partial [Gigaspora rosea]